MLVRVLIKRGCPIYADSLVRSFSGEAVDIAEASDLDWLGSDEDKSGSTRFLPDERQEILGTMEISRERDEIRKLQRAITECGDDPGLAREKSKLELELDQRVEYLKKSTRCAPSGALVPKSFDDSLKKAGNLVGKNIGAALKQLKKIDEELWKHLFNKDILKFGQVCLYSSESGYRWQKK
jgi:hypothetical protein